MVVQNLRPGTAEFQDKGKSRFDFLNLLSFRHPEHIVPNGKRSCVWQGRNLTAQKFDRGLSFEIASDLLSALV